MRASLPDNEAARLQALEKYQILDTLPESAFDDLTRLAAYICGVPIALVSLIDCDRQWFKSKVGLEISQTPRDISFCAHGILQSDLLIVRDTLQDNRFADNPLVIGEPYARFYAGVPLIDADGFALGTLCVLDIVPRDLSVEQQEALATLSRQVETQLNLRRNVIKLQESIAQYQQADEARQKSEQKLALHFQQTPVAVIEWNLNFAIVGWNQAAEIIFGYSHDEAIGRHAAGLLVPISARHEVDRVMKDLLAQTGGTFNTNANLTKAGKIIICEWHNTPLIDEQGAVVGVASIAQDITDRFLAEKALQESEEKYRSVINNTKQVIFQTDIGGAWTFLNPAWQELTGFSPQESIGNNFLDYIHKRDRQQNLASFQALMQRQVECSRHEVRFLTSNGSERWMELYACPFVDKKGRVCGTCGTLQDISDRKLAEAALQESETLFKAVFDQAFQFIGLLTPDGVISAVNQTALDFGGATLEAVVGRLVWETLWFRHSIAEQEKLKAAIFQATAGKLIRYEVDVIGTGDTVVSIDFSIKPVHNEIGEVSLLILEGRDISDRKLAEAALQESERLFKAVFDQAFQFIGLLSVDGVVLTVNQTALDFGGITSSEVVGELFWETLWWRHSNAEQEKLKAAVSQAAAGEFIRYEVDIVGAGDIVASVDFSIKPVKDKIGQVTLLILEGRDITQRKLAELALQSSLATNRALIEALPDLMFRLSSDGVFVNYKAGKGNNLLIPASEFLGKNIYEVMPPEVAEPILNCIKQALATGDVQIFEYERVVERKIFYCEARIAVSAENEVMAIVRDITERKQAEAEIRNALETERQLSELKSRFVTMTSHEFRTPLTTILSSAELLEDFGANWSLEKQHQHLHRIQSNVKHMTQLLEDVMLISKSDMGKLPCNPVLLDVVQFCRDSIDDLLISSQYSHNISFVSQHHRFNAYLDDKLLHPILSNLLANAIKYSSAGSNIRFRLICQAEKISFHIQDEGMGIPIDEQAYLFDSFYRASNVGTISGTGLGLAIVKKAVDLHRGKIAVRSEIGAGTTFLVSLPLIEEKIDE